MHTEGNRYGVGTSEVPPPYEDGTGPAMSDPMAPTIPDLRPGDIVIAVMGVTGAGKSTFISYFNSNATVGDSLMSCTSKVGIHEALIPYGNSQKKIYLIDTPGFDDSVRSDTDILREIADWLSRSYQAQIKLAGIIYLHRIGDPRLGGAALKNLRMFRKLCGDERLNCVILATTFWSEKPTNGEVAKEHELVSSKQFWKPMVDAGSQVFRQDNEAVSAIRIIQYILSQNHEFNLKIQEEMAGGKSLDETDAGQEAQAEIAAMRAAHEKEIRILRQEMEEARMKNDIKSANDIAALKAEFERKIEEEDMKRQRLMVDMKELQAQRDEEIRKEREEMYEKQMKHKEEMWRRQAEMEAIKAKNQFERELIEANYMGQMKDAELARLKEEDRLRKQKKEEECIIL